MKESKHRITDLYKRAISHTFVLHCTLTGNIKQKQQSI